MDNHVLMDTIGMVSVVGNHNLEIMEFQTALKDSIGMELLALLSQRELPINIAEVDTNGEDLHVELLSMDHLLLLEFMGVMGC